MIFRGFKKALLAGTAFFLLGSAAASAQVIIQPIFHTDDNREVVAQRPIPANDRHRNYNWDYWRHHSDPRDDHRNPHDPRR